MADINELMQVRREKMQKIIDSGNSVHPERYERTHSIKAARELPDGTKNVSIAATLHFILTLLSCIISFCNVPS